MKRLKTTSAETPQLFLAQEMSEVARYSFLGGVACVFSSRSPNKETPNEDAAALIPFNQDSGILVVADGVGGYSLGDRASASTIEVLRDSLQAGLHNGEILRTAVLNGIESANRTVMDLGAGASTTLALVEIQSSTARPYHIGDSVICILGQRGKLKLQTVAHSPVGFALEAGLLSEEEAMHHEERHLVSNIIGREDMRIEIGAVSKLLMRDTVLLGSDGLFDNLHVSEIVEFVRKGPLEDGVRRLASKALDRMGHPGGHEPSKPDDMTIVAFRSSGV